MARIVTVCNAHRRGAELVDMAAIRWLKISEALARLGHEVDMATPEFKWRWPKPDDVRLAENLRKVPLSRVQWMAYDVVKTLFQTGFDIVRRGAGTRHPFIIAKLGSVVGPRDTEGIYFYGRARARLYETQTLIAEHARFVTVLSEPARQLWVECFGRNDNILLIPGAADRDIPDPGPDPFPDSSGLRCLFAGNFYSKESQPDAHKTIVDKLNELGRHLSVLGARLYVLGPGDHRRLDSRWVTYLGSVPYDRSWDYLHHAHVGVVVAAGAFMHNNESTKIYHYLRVGLPVVSEAGFPNDDVVRASGGGLVVRNGDLEGMAARVVEVSKAKRERDRVIRYILKHHTWDRRAEVYDRILTTHFPR